MRMALAAGLCIVASLTGCGGATAQDPKIKGTWEQVSFRARGPTPPASQDDADPVGIVEASFRSNGLLTARYEQEGSITSVVGTWKRAAESSGKSNSTSFVVRMGMIDGKPVSREARDRSVQVWIDNEQSLLWFPAGVDATTGRFKEAWIGLQRR